MGAKLIATGTDASARRVIVTKVRPPRRRRDLLSRQRLISYLADNIDRKLILVSAPAGYGKTSLLVDFVAESNFPICWYRLDAADGDAGVFFEHLIASLQQRYEGVCERTVRMLRTEGSIDIEAIVGSLVNEIDEQIPEFFLLVLDDYQKVDDSLLVNAAVDAFLYYLPDNCRVVITSRTLPKKLTLTRLAGEGQVAGVGQTQLCFTPTEIRELVHHLHGLDLSDEEAEHLSTESEGWITALVMGSERLLDGARAGLSHLAADRVALFDFLAQEVYMRQPEDVREFLLTSAILESLTPEMCDAVLERTDSAEMLRRLEEQNLFLMRIEVEAQWYRYHQLFHDFLLTRLAAAARADTRALHRRAAAWFHRAGQPDYEIGHLLEAGDIDAAAARMEAEVEDAFSRGRLGTIIGWANALPRDVLLACPALLLRVGSAHEYQGNLADALAVLGWAVDHYEAVGDDERLAAALAERAPTWRLLGQVHESLADSRQALRLTRDPKSQTAGNAHRNLGACHALNGNMTAAAEELAAALEAFEASHIIWHAASTHADLSGMYQLAGDIERSLVHAAAARRYWEEVGNTGALARVLNNMATAYHAQGRFTEAKHWLEEAASKARLAGVRRIEASALVGLGDVESDLDDFDGAVTHYEQGTAIAQAVGDGTLVCYALAAGAEALRLGGKPLQAAGRLAQAREELAVHRSAFETALVDYVRGTMALTRDEFERAAEHLEDAARGFHTLGSQREEARALLHRCAVAHRMGDTAGAGHWWSQAEAVMDDFGYRSSFDPYVRRLPEVAARERIRDVRSARRADAAGPAVGPTVMRDGRHGAEAGPAPRDVGIVVLALGPVEVSLDGERVDQKAWQTVTARDLFLYLVDRPAGATREQIMLRFWPDSSAIRARSSLHSTLYRVRRVLGRDSVASDAERYAITARESLFYDVAEFERLVEQADAAPSDKARVELLEAAAGLARGDYAQGIAEEWCHERREEIGLAIVDALLALADACLRLGQTADAIGAYRRTLERDELREEAHRGLMRAFAATGDRARALRQFDTLSELLDDELGIRPDAESVAVYQAIRDEREVPAA